MYLEEVDGHIPLSAVGDEVGGEEADEAVVERTVCELDGLLEVVVAFVEFVP